MPDVQRQAQIRPETAVSPGPVLLAFAQRKWGSGTRGFLLRRRLNSRGTEQYAIRTGFPQPGYAGACPIDRMARTCGISP